MAKRFEEICAFMEEMGIPGRDPWDLPTSALAFPDGANYRIEIAGVERPSTFRAMVHEANKRKIAIHRAIATVGGATYCTYEELGEMASVARSEGIELVTTIGHRKGWDAGSREMSNPEGCMQGFRLRGSDNIAYWFEDLFRAIEAGIRGFLVYDEGVLSIASEMRRKGFIPAETIFKFSVFGGYCSAAGVKVLEKLGANTMNPSSDVSLPILAGIRKASKMPLDVYIIVVDSFGGMFRAYETPEIVRVASPCYLKYEPGTSEGDIYKPWVSESFHDELIRQKVKLAAITREVIERRGIGLKMSEQGAPDLVLPVA